MRNVSLIPDVFKTIPDANLLISSFSPVSRWTLHVQSVPPLRVQWGKHCILLGLWGLPGNKTFKTGRQSKEDLRRIHRLWRATRGKYKNSPYRLFRMLPVICRCHLSHCEGLIVTSPTLLLPYRWILTMWPKPSQRRTWRIPTSPVSTWPKPKSTPWWRKTATPAFWSPPHT